MKYRLAHRISIPKPYVPAVASDVAKTMKAERKRLAEQEAAKPFKVLPLRKESRHG